MSDDDPRPRVLLVEDDDNFRRLTRWWLDAGGYDVVGEAVNGEEGVRLARDLAPDIVLLDIRMPVMDGYEALPHIRAAAPDAKVIVLTGLEPDEVRGRVKVQGVDAVVEKDVRPDALLDVMAAAVQEKAP